MDATDYIRLVAIAIEIDSMLDFTPFHFSQTLPLMGLCIPLSSGPYNFGPDWFNVLTFSGYKQTDRSAGQI